MKQKKGKSRANRDALLKRQNQDTKVASMRKLSLGQVAQQTQKIEVGKQLTGYQNYNQ